MMGAFIVTLCIGSTAYAQLRSVFKDDAAPHNEIRKISFYSPSDGYVAFRDWIGFTTDSGRTFTKKYITLSNVNYNGYGVNLTVGFFIGGVIAFDQNTIIAYGDYGLVPAILRSTDGGNSFLLVYHSQFSPNQLSTGITDMVFPGNGNTGFAVDADRILHSADKGNTWTISYTNAGKYFSSIEAVDQNTIFAISTRYSNSLFYKTVDAGASWTAVLAPVGNLKSLHFITATKGWANTDEKVFYTSNGGQNWVQKNHSFYTPFTAKKMKFINDHTGYALTEGFEVYKTSDSGRIWEPLERDNDFTFLGYTHNDLQLWGNDQLWAGGGHGFLELATNSSAAQLPRAFFQIDTSGMWVAKVVQLKNYSKTNYTYQWIVNGVPVGLSYNASYVHDIYLAADTVKLIVNNGTHTDTTEKIHYFEAVPYPAPLVNIYLPNYGGTGTQVTITGNFFAKITGVYFGGIPASSYEVKSLTTIIAVVGAGGNGSVSVSSATGTGSRAGFITYPPPLITGLSPAFAQVGSVVTVTGSNFGASPAENIVFFGGVRATVLSAAPGELTVAVPAGATYAPVSVTVNNHTGTSLQHFSVTFPATCGFTGATFDEPKRFATNSSGFDIATLGIADLDGDGKADVAVPSNKGVVVLKNKSTKGFIDFQKVLAYEKTQATLTSAGTADLDGDGKPDLVTTNEYHNTLEIYHNTSSIGSISFAAPLVIRPQYGGTSPTFYDLDGDGKPEMVVLSGTMNEYTISIYRNISLPGNIAFEPPQKETVGLYHNKVSFGDLDGDGKPDIFVGDAGILGGALNTFTILRNTSSIGSISFARTVVPHHTVAYADGDLADMDGDGKLDVVLAYEVRYTLENRQSVAVYKNNSTPGNILFAAPVPYHTETTFGNMALGDLDGDGKIDLFGSCTGINACVALVKNTSSPGSISLLKVNGAYYSMYGGSGKSAIIDIDNDSRPDILYSGRDYLNVSRNILGTGVLAGKDTTICIEQSVKLGELDVADHTYAWTSSEPGFSSTLANPVVSPTVNTDYYVAVTNPSGCVARDTIHVTVGGDAPYVNAGTNGSVCEGGSMQIGMNGDPGHTYSWTSMPAGFTSTEPNPVVTPISIQTNYILTVNNGSCVDKDTVGIYQFPWPKANAGPDWYRCPDGKGITIGSYTDDPSNINTYSWTSNPAGFTSNFSGNVVYPRESTTYYLEVTAPPGCKAYDTVYIGIVSVPVPAITAAGPLTFCEGGSVTLTSSIDSGNQWWKNGNYIADSTSSSITVTQSGSYTVHHTIDNFCTASSTPVVVTVNALTAPQITAGGNTSFCIGGSVVLTSSSAQGNQWYKNGVAIAGAVSNKLTATETGQYSVRYTSETDGCLSNISVPIAVTVNATLPAPQITANGNTSFCAGHSVVLISSSIQGNQWYKNGVAIAGAVNNKLTAAETGEYSVRYTSEADGCLSNNVSAPITVVAMTAPPIPVITQTGNTLISSADTTNQWYLNAIAIPGATTRSWQPVTSGVYSVGVTQSGCASVFSIPFNYTIPVMDEPGWRERVSLSPNPVQGDVLEIRIAGDSASFTATVLDMNGQPVKTQGLFINNCILNLRSLNAGMYVVRIFNIITKEYVSRVIVKQ
jgi:hypothetical protein